MLLYNIKKNIIENIDDIDTIIDKLYYFEYRPITKNDIKNNKDTNIDKIIKNKKNIIKYTKIKISLIENKIPLYDPYSNNIFIISKYFVYNRVVFNYYRFPDKNILNNLRENNYQRNDKNKLMVKFMNYFDLDILYNTYVLVFYKYSVFTGMEITTCQKPSFLPQFYHITPFFTKSETIKLALNFGIINKNDLNNNLDINDLCKKILNYDMNFNMLLSHKKYMNDNICISILQYYTLQGSSIMNSYLRNLTLYKEKNEYLENLISPIWNLLLNSPEFDKDYILYRFVKNDSYLLNLKIGDIYTEKGFLSSTRNPFYNSNVYQFGFILIKIIIPKNIKGVGLCLETISHFPHEQEIIFPPLSKFKLINKDENCIYYNVDEKFASKVKTRYEFKWIGNDGVKFTRTLLPPKLHKVNFLNIEKKPKDNLAEKISHFEKNYVNNMNLFEIELGGKNIIVKTEINDTTDVYSQYFSVKTKKLYSIYSIYQYCMLFFIEIFENGNVNEMSINYYVKYRYNEIDPNDIVGDENLIYLYSTIAYHFGIHNVYLYANYKNCNSATDNDKIFGGNYCIDFYQYITTNKKKYFELNILTEELHPVFSYFELDFLKTISPSRIITDITDELYQVYNKIYLTTKNKDNIIDFYIWLITYKCYLLNKFVNLIDFILEKNNPFKNDKYILNPISYLYNRNFINFFNK